MPWPRSEGGPACRTPTTKAGARAASSKTLGWTARSKSGLVTGAEAGFVIGIESSLTTRNWIIKFKPGFTWRENDIRNWRLRPTRVALESRPTIFSLESHCFACFPGELSRGRTTPAPGFELSFRGQAQRLHLLGLEFTELARLEVEDERPVANPTNLLDVVADLLEHLAQFAVAPLNDDDFIPGIVPLADLTDLCRSCADSSGAGAGTTLLDHNALAQDVEHVFGWIAGYLDQVGLFNP